MQRATSHPGEELAFIKDVRQHESRFYSAFVACGCVFHRGKPQWPRPFSLLSFVWRLLRNQDTYCHSVRIFLFHMPGRWILKNAQKMNFKKYQSSHQKLSDEMETCTLSEPLVTAAWCVLGLQPKKTASRQEGGLRMYWISKSQSADKECSPSRGWAWGKQPFTVKWCIYRKTFYRIGPELCPGSMLLAVSKLGSS